MKKNAKLSLNRETLRILALEGPLRQAAGGAPTSPYTWCAITECVACHPEPSGKPACHDL